MTKKNRSKKRYFLLMAVIALVYAAYSLLSSKDPAIGGYEAFQKIPRAEKITLTVKNDRPIRRFQVDVVQGFRTVSLIDETSIGREKTYNLDLVARKLGIMDGAATVILKAESGFFSATRVEVAASVDTVPPAIKRVASTPFVRQGSTGAVRVMAVGADRVYVKIGSNTFPLFESPDGERNVYASLFAVGSDVSPDEDVTVVAEDGNENVRTAVMDTTITESKFNEEAIKVSDRFLEKHIYPLVGENSEGISPVDAIKLVNEAWRKDDRSFLRDLAAETSPEPLWKGRFLQLDGSSVLARYGERRELYYHGERVSTSRHLGYDLASVRHAPVAAANSGRVVYAGKRKIYGNTVVIDHGLGLMSLYGHLSEISVSEGQAVSKGDVIGRTGSTGFAMGDHLHFAILVDGIPVNPLDWWDGSWIEHRIGHVLS